MPEGSAQRQFPRYLIQLPILHKTRGPAPVRVGVGWTRNVSEGGACMELADRLPPQTRLRVALRTDRGGIEVEAEVVWSGEPGPLKEGILHGVAFTHLSSDQLRDVRGLIRTKGQVRTAGVRFPLTIPATCKPADRSGQSLEGTTGDISRGGLLLLLPEILPSGTRLAVTLHVAEGPITVGGTVVWAEPPAARTLGPPFRHGLQFTGLGWSTWLSLGLFLAEPA